MVVGHFGGPCVAGHVAYIYDRGGTRRVAQLQDLSSVQWSRDRDGISEATIEIQGSACSAQAEILAQIEPRRSELVLFRGLDRVWEGPVHRVAWHSAHVEINAHDVFEYVMNTPLSKAYSSAYPNVETVTGRIARILTDEMPVWEALDPPANIMPHFVAHHFVNEAQTTAVTKPFEMTVGEHIQHLAHYSGVDYTCIGRALHVWDVSRPLGEIRTLTEADFFSEMVVTAYGADMAAKAYVVAQDGRYGSAAAADYSYYGPWTRIVTAYNEEGTEGPTQAELNSQAKSALYGRIPVPVNVRIPDGSGIRLSESVTIQDLVPGVRIPLLATLNARQLSQVQKLDHLQVVETADGEDVQVTMSPATRPDSDDEELPREYLPTV